MIIIQLAGGLGNQMFQYALYMQLKSLGKDVKIDDRSGFEADRLRQPALSPFGVTYERPTGKELRTMLDSSPLPWSKVRRKLFGRHKKSYFEEDKLFHPEIFTWDDIYLEGYWQSEKYFEAVAEQVRAAYDTDKLIRNIMQRKDATASETGAAVTGTTIGETAAPGDGFEKYLHDITHTESVSLHIRRGDYLTPENVALFGGICTEDYYRRAMELMRQKIPGCQFYLFTNDRAWIKGIAESAARGGVLDNANVTRGGASDMMQDVTLVELPENARKDYAEFALMSKCRHHILANSSFSWWASYLNQNPDKTVIAPDAWLNGWDCRDIYRADMTRLG
jgi:hypothetical protein